MKLTTSEVEGLLRDKPGRYILDDMGMRHVMKEADGTDVIIDGHIIEPHFMQVDDLMAAGRLVVSGREYRLAPGEEKR